MPCWASDLDPNLPCGVQGHTIYHPRWDRRPYADMAVTDMLLRDEAESCDPPAKSIQSADHPALQDGKFSELQSRAARDQVRKELDDTELFNRVARGNERFDDEWIEGVDELVHDEGVLVGRQEWDSGGPGAGAGTVDVYEFRGVFISYNDANRYVCETFTDAAKAVELFTETDATTEIWVDPRFS